MEKEEEIWKDIPGFEMLYQASTFGRLRSLDRDIKSRWGGYRTIKGRVLKTRPDKDGYLYTILTNLEGVRKTMHVHRCVALAFVPNPDNLPCVNHKNEIKDSNFPSNLEWCTVAYNNAYNGRHQRIGNKNAIAILRCDEKGNVLERFKSARAAAAVYGGDGSCITACCRGKQSMAYGFYWKYENKEKRIEKKEAINPRTEVDQYSIDGKFIASYASITEASNATGIFAQSIGAVCNGYNKHANGFVFRHKGEPFESKGKIGKLNNVPKMVKQYTLDGEYIQTFLSVRDAALSLGNVKAHVSDCCNGYRNHCGGYKWKWA